MHNGNSRRRRKKDQKAIFSPKIVSDTKSQIQEIQRTSNKINSKLCLGISYSNYRKS
jgi:hypothetical protein